MIIRQIKFIKTTIRREAEFYINDTIAWLISVVFCYTASSLEVFDIYTQTTFSVVASRPPFRSACCVQVICRLKNAPSFKDP